MVSIASLWLPITLSAVAVFVASSIIHMVLGYHRNDYKGLPDEAGVMDALRPFDIPPGEYVMPHTSDPKVMKSPEFQEKMAKGPMAFVNFLPRGDWGMGRALVQWFIYCIVVGVFAAYLTGRAIGPDQEYMTVFRFAGTISFVGYALALWQGSIWYKRAWSTTLKSTFDGLIYALLTGGIFGSMWP